MGFSSRENEDNEMTDFTAIRRPTHYLKGKEVKAQKHFLLSRPGKWENGFWTGLLVGAVVIFLVVNAVWIWF